MPKTTDEIILDEYVLGQMVLERTDWSSTVNYAKSLRDMLDDITERIPKLRGTKRQKLIKAKTIIVNNLRAIYDNYGEDLQDDKENSAHLVFGDSIEVKYRLLEKQLDFLESGDD